MSRLTEKLQRAAGVAGRVTQKIEERADALIEREADLKVKVENAFTPHEAVLDGHHRDLDEVENALRQLSNEPIGLRSSEVAQK